MQVDHECSTGNGTFVGDHRADREPGELRGACNGTALREKRFGSEKDCGCNPQRSHSTFFEEMAEMTQMFTKIIGNAGSAMTSWVNRNTDLTGVTTLDVVRANKFVYEATGAPVDSINVCGTETFKLERSGKFPVFLKVCYGIHS